MTTALGSGLCTSLKVRSSNSRISVIRPATAGLSASSPDPACCSRRSAVVSGLACVGLVLQVPRPTFAQTPEVAAEPSKKFVDSVLADPAVRQRLDNGLMLLAPIRGSRSRLKEAENRLGKVNVYDPNPRIFREALGTIRMAAMNCYDFEPLADDTFETKVSALQAQLKLGDACTFRLIAKNVTSLLPASQSELREETNQSLKELLNAFQLLDDLVDRASEGDANAMERVADCLQFAIAHTATFENNIEKCLGLPISQI